ncbi:MAG TPA: hypothetical protein VMS17_31805 [Gemmataceae bacterium]|nr:hypothetical protein [Gemmataceae bacterium]
MNRRLEHLAGRVAGAPDFLASALAEYARSEQLADAALAARLGCTAETLTHLRLCRMPRGQAPLFWQDVAKIAGRFSVDADLVAEIARRGQSLMNLRKVEDGRIQEPGFLLAARDDGREEKPPEGAP